MAFNFDGTQDISYTGGYGTSFAAISVAVFVKPDSLASRSDMATKWGSTGNRLWNMLQGVTSNRAQFYVSDGTAIVNSGADTSDLITTAWQHIGGSWSAGNNVRLWRDGSNTATSAGTMAGTLDPISTASFTLGNGDEATPQYYSGSMAEFAMWDVELTAVEFAALSAGASPLLVRPSDLRSYIPMGAGNHDFIFFGANPGTESSSVARVEHPPISLGPHWTTAAYPPSAGGVSARPQGPFGHPLIGAFGGPI